MEPKRNDASDWLLLGILFGGDTLPADADPVGDDEDVSATFAD